MSATALPLSASIPPIAPAAGKAKIKFGGTDDFHKALKARVDRYFRLTGRKPRDCWQMYLKSVILFAWLIASYALLVFVATEWWQYVPLTASLGLALASIGFNVQHDGGHKAVSNKPWVNRMAAMSLDLIGGSSYNWDHKHNTIHHTYANIHDHDDDINVGMLGRLAPEQPHLWFHRLQHIYLWFLYGFIAVKWQLFDDFRDVARGRIGEHRFARPKGWHLVQFIAGKVVFLTLAFGVPMLFHPWWVVLLFYFFVAWVNGIVIATIFQLAHVVEEAKFPLPNETTGRMDTHWAVHQVLTTVNFARRNPVLTWLVGGLNYQVEHHLFPRICHIHYPRLSKLVESTCRKFDLPYNAHPTLFAGIASHIRWLRAMGQPAS